MRNQELGFDKNQILVFKSPRVRGDLFKRKFQSFKESLLGSPDISKICHVTEVPGRQIYWDAGAIQKAGEDLSKGKNYQIMGIDYDFADLFDIKVIEGRNFSKEFPSDNEALILNETAVKWMEFENAKSAVGQRVDYWGDIFTIVGVFKDYHQQSPKESFEPTIFRFLPQGRDIRGLFAVKVNNHNVPETIQHVNKQYAEMFPGNPFEYFFLDEYFDQQYKADELFGRVFGLFSILAIFVTALGIYGLSSFNAEQRTKEIGIRKILGANISSILILLNKDILILLLFSFLISLPLSIIGFNYWLADFANRMDFNSLLFIMRLSIVGFITTLTVSYQTIKSAMVNPVEVLVCE